MFFLRMLLRPSTSTLFPYTTLFRSRGRHIGPADSAHIHSGAEGSNVLHDAATNSDQMAASISTHFTQLGYDFRHRLDRKSTRLNSSHRCISYAVFCLKKKK